MGSCAVIFKGSTCSFDWYTLWYDARAFQVVFLIVSCDSVLQGSPDWLGSDDSPLEGFTWRGGSERDTTGILLWSEPFFCRMRNGEEVVDFLVVVFFFPSCLSRMHWSQLMLSMKWSGIKIVIDNVVYLFSPCRVHSSLLMLFDTWKMYLCNDQCLASWPIAHRHMWQKLTLQFSRPP